MSAPTDRRSLSTVLIAVPIAVLLALVGGAVCIALAFGGESGCGTASAATGNVQGVPAKLIPIYQQAAAKYHLGPKGPAILAGINWEETAFGTNLGVSSAEAEGWMQLPAIGVTWGIGSTEELREAGAGSIVDIPAELPASVKQLLGNARFTQSAY